MYEVNVLIVNVLLYYYLGLKSTWQVKLSDYALCLYSR